MDLKTPPSIKRLLHTPPPEVDARAHALELPRRPSQFAPPRPKSVHTAVSPLALVPTGAPEDVVVLVPIDAPGSDAEEIAAEIAEPITSCDALLARESPSLKLRQREEQKEAELEQARSEKISARRAPPRVEKKWIAA